MKRIIYFTPSIHNSGGTDRVLSMKANYFAENGERITIVTTELSEGTPFFEFSDKINVIHLNFNFNEILNDPLPIKYLRFKRKLQVYKTQVERIVASIKPDICISMFGKEIEFFHQLKDPSIKIGEIHFTTSFRKQFLLAHNRRWYSNILGDIRNWQLEQSIKRLNHVVVLTNQDLKAWISVKNKSCIYNPDPYSLTPFKSVESKEKKTILSVGRLSAEKGYDRLVHAWAGIANRFPEWKVRIVGDGSLRNKLSEIIKTSGVEDSFELAPSTKIIQNEFANSSVFVMSSHYEGLPMTMIEASHFGLPIISFDCPCGPREIIKDGYNGLLVENGNIEALSQAMARMIEDTDLRNKMSINSLERSNIFSLDTIMSQWYELFNSLETNR